MKLKLLLLINITLISIAYSQTNTIKPVIPTSPQAETIKMFGDHNISYFYGTINIEVPLFKLSHYDYELPVNLQYLPTTIKPNYNYDVFGHGWSLSINSCISRSIDDLPDENSSFKLNSNILNNVIPIGSTSTVYNRINTLNLAYDKFNATLPDGSSFEFIIDGNNYTNATPIVTNGRNVKIHINYSNSNIYTFEVTDEKGIKYIFDEGDIPLLGTTNLHMTSNVSWKLVKIIFPYTEEPIEFFYEKSIKSESINTVVEDGIMMMHEHIPASGNQQHATNLVNINKYKSGQSIGHQMKLLTKVKWGQNQLLLNYHNPSSLSNHNFVNKIELKSGQITTKVFDLNMTKYNGWNMGVFQIAKLNSLTVNNDSNGKEKYSFEYQTTDYNYYGTDHWGNSNYLDTRNLVSNFNVFVEFDLNYHQIVDNNGNTTNPYVYNVIKKPNETTPYAKLKLHNWSISDIREANKPWHYGVLKKIIYPTGGSTTYEFENHKYLSSTDENGDYIIDIRNRRIANAGGFRIYKIINSDANNNVLSIKNIRYGQQFKDLQQNQVIALNHGINTPYLHTGIGEFFVEPNIKTYSMINSYCRSNRYFQSSEYLGDFSNILRNMIIGLGPLGESAFTNTFSSYSLDTNTPNFYLSWKWVADFNVQNFRRLLNGRPSVVYPYVTEYSGEVENYQGFYNPIGGNGKIEYNYVMQNENGLFPEPLKRSRNRVYYESEGVYYNRLKTKNTYKHDTTTVSKFSLMKSEVFNWYFNKTSILEYLNSNTYPAGNDTIGNLTYSDYINERYFHYGNALLSSVRNVEYINSDSIQTVESYGYVDNRLSVKKNYNSDSTQLITQYVYADFKDLNGNDISSLLKAKNMIGIPVEVYTTRTNMFNDDESFVSGEKTKFTQLDNNLIKPYRNYKMVINDKDSGYQLIAEVLKFNDAGRPILIKSKEKKDVFDYFVWSYNNQFVIAHFQNVKFEEISIIEHQLQQLFNSNLNQLGVITPNESTIQTMHATFNNHLVNTYTYYPINGLKTSTNVNGITTHFVKDSIGRLIEVYMIENGKKIIIESYKYNYLNN